MRTNGFQGFMRAALVLSLAATGCGKSADGGDDSDAGTGGEAAGGQVTGGQSNGGDTGGQANGGDTGGQSNGGDVGGQGGGGDAGGSGGEGLPLGAACESPPFCQGNEDDVPGCCTGGPDDSDACQTGGCRSGVCERRFSELIGVCTRDCMRDSACENFSDGPLGSAYTCVHDDTDGLCLPGSNQRCDGGANGACPDGEICTFGRTFSADAQYGGLCQPPREGAATGEACDDDKPCANGMCLAGRCSTFCDPSAESGPCSNGMSCFDNFPVSSDGSITLDICLPGYCEKNSDCAEGEVCGIALDFSGEPYIVGICQAMVEGEPQVGDVCPTGVDYCGGGNLCIDDYCTGFCDSDADCPNGACSTITLLLDSVTMQSAQAQICRTAPPGSGRECENNEDCAASGDTPAEACDLIIRGVVTGGRPEGDISVSGRCVAIPGNAVAPGEACTDQAPCATASLCDRGYCSQLCQTTGNCGEGAYCGTTLISDNDTQSFADDLYTGLCVADTGSHDACVKDADCVAGTEFCRSNVLLQSGTPTLETFCSGNSGAGMATAGGDCGGNQDCVSGRCNAWSRVAADPGYCFGLCQNDADCSADGTVTCEQFTAFSGDEGAEDDLSVTACVPAHVCASCDFAAGQRPCAGTTTCSLVDFAGGRAGGACLEPCGAGDACPKGFACQAARDGAGTELAGQDVCAPVAADETCLSARPLR